MTDMLETAVARKLLASTIPARLAFVSPSGSANVTPIWFLWRDEKIVMCSLEDAAKVKAIQKNPEIAVTIDSEKPPYESIRVRGRAELEFADGVIPEYVECAHRYYGVDRGDQWIKLMRTNLKGMVKISLAPDWVEVFDFRERFPGLFN